MDKIVWTSNIRGLISNLTSLQNELNISKPALVIICETFLTDSVPDCALTIPGYSFFRKDRNTHGGGIIIYF